MRVALELQPCCGKLSGIGLYTYELARRLRDEDGLKFQGNLFNFLGRDNNQGPLAEIKMPIRESHAFPYGVYRRIWNFVPIPYNALFAEADLNLFFNYIVPPRVKGKVVTTIYDMTYLRFPETMDKKNLRRLQKGLECSIRRSNRIITISEFSKREIVELLDVPEEKISIVYSAPSLPTEEEAFSTVAEKFKLQKPYLLYVGTIEPRKNLERLLRAFELLKEKERIPHQMVLAGGKGWKSEGIYATASKTACSGDVVFTGYFTSGEKRTLYKNADAFVFPSLYEGFGMPPLEAMAFDCPVICSNAASLPEVVGDAAELVDPFNEDDIARGINRVLREKEYAAALVKRGQSRMDKFTWKASAGKLKEICREVFEES